MAGATAAYTPGTRSAAAAAWAGAPGAEDVSTSAGVSTPDGTPPWVSVTSVSCAGPLVAYTSAKVDRPSRVTNAGLCVVA